MLKKTIQEICSINTKQFNLYMNGKKAKIANNITIYKYKKIL